MGHPLIMRRTGRSLVWQALSTGPIAFLLTYNACMRCVRCRRQCQRRRSYLIAGGH